MLPYWTCYYRAAYCTLKIHVVLVCCCCNVGSDRAAGVNILNGGRFGVYSGRTVMLKTTVRERKEHDAGTDSRLV